MDLAIVYIYECQNCQRIYPRVAGQPLACHFCQSHEREELGNGYNTLELIDNLIEQLSPTMFKETLKMIDAKNREKS